MIVAAFRRFVAAGAFIALSACATVPAVDTNALERAAIEQNLRRDIEILASDDFGGRKPGTDGEAKTLAFIQGELQKAGLVSGTNDPASEWRAPVELVSIEPYSSSITIRTGKRTIKVNNAEATAITSRRRELVDGAKVVFVGNLGEEAPAEMVSGSIVVMLGEPGESPARRAALFAKNPVAVVTVVEDQLAITRQNRFYRRERVQLASETDTSLSAYVTKGAMEDAFGEENWTRYVALAGRPDFQPKILEATMAIEASANRREFASNNLLGKLPGTDPDAGAILLLGHWDHLGECGPLDAEDRICNGAVDNASGIASMLELIRRLAATGPFDRDIYVLATTAEENGLLGARAFIEAPSIPLDNIVAAFNFDTVAIAPEGSSVGFVGEGRSALDPIIREVMQAMGRTQGDKALAERFERRQDGWALLQEGVPSVLISTSFGSEEVLGPFLETDYHRAGDEVEAIVLGGAIDDLLLHEALVRRFANISTYPTPPSQ